MKLEVMDIFNERGEVKILEPNHFTTTDLRTKAEAASLYMLADNYLSADYLFEELISKPSNESWYQVMLAIFVFKLDSFPAKRMQTYGVSNWSNLIRSRRWFWFYPALIFTDMYIKHPIEVMFSKTYLPTWTCFVPVKYENKMNQDILKRVLTN